MLAIGVFTTRHWQTSGRLVQELNVGTVVIVFSRCCVGRLAQIRLKTNIKTPVGTVIHALELRVY